MIQEKLERLVAAGIEIVPVSELSRHLMFGRDGFVALVERRDDGFGNIGAAGLATEAGFAALAWRGDQPFFIARGFERAATPEEVATLRAFERDLHAALA